MYAQPQPIETCGERKLFHKQSLPVIGRSSVSPDIRRFGGNSGALRCSFRETSVCVRTRRHASVASGFRRDNCGCGESGERGAEKGSRLIGTLPGSGQGGAENAEQEKRETQ